ncbi:hypothetical protein Ahy_B05g076337 [Arachis hypogaea]|uniref:HTH myb-type domain-containing protein n=1 Tax=Arachis hypogaea TaxID=3818 RepID=A0A444Z322_ARAHY|nr:hypothetical protein Ahy_B05g076337 [Arachis hypogaea]
MHRVSIVFNLKSTNVPSIFIIKKHLPPSTSRVQRIQKHNFLLPKIPHFSTIPRHSPLPSPLHHGCFTGAPQHTLSLNHKPYSNALLKARVFGEVKLQRGSVSILSSLFRVGARNLKTLTVTGSEVPFTIVAEADGLFSQASTMTIWSGLLRCGKSCRLRWINYLRPDIKRGNFTIEEEETIIKLHEMLGNRSSATAIEQDDTYVASSRSSVVACSQGFTSEGITNVSSDYVCGGKKRLKEHHSDKGKVKNESQRPPHVAWMAQMTLHTYHRRRQRSAWITCYLGSTKAKKKSNQRDKDSQQHHHNVGYFDFLLTYSPLMTLQVDLTTDSVGHDEFVTPYGRRDTKCKLDDDKCYNRFPLRYSGGKKQILEVMLVKLDRILKNEWMYLCDTQAVARIVVRPACSRSVIVTPG